jgi:hypothetical protein
MREQELIKGWNPPDIGDDEHIVRRLGWAVVRAWPKLPADIRALLQETAVFTEDRYPTVQLNEQISVFVRKHEGGR